MRKERFVHFVHPGRKEAKRPELDLIWEKTERRDVKFFVIYLSFSSQLSSLVVP
jgi:hypothetical protein